MNRTMAAGLLSILVAMPAAEAGVVMNMASKDASGQEAERMQFFVQSGQVRMDVDGERSGDNASMVFLGNQFLLIDHNEKTYIVMDQAMLDEVGSQVSSVMKEMEAELASMPPEQRAMVEQMMKGRMQGMLPDAAEKAPKPRVEPAGSGQWEDYKCDKYTVYEGDNKTQEICASPLGDIDGAEEMMQAFRGMAAYMEKVRESMPGPLAAGMAGNPAEIMDRINGFPVHTVDFKDGSPSAETWLESMTEENLDSALFAPPEGYKRTDPLRGR